MSDFERDARIRTLLEAAPLPGRGSPEGVVTANPGRLYVDLDGGAGVTLWVKESGSGDTGWISK